MEFKVDWDAVPAIDGEVKPRPLRAVSLYKMDARGFRKLTTCDSFKEMDQYIRDYSSTGHNRMKVCVLSAHWDVEENFKGYGVMMVPVRIDRKLSMETNICEKALLHDALRQCSYIREETSAKREAGHTNALTTSLYCLDGLRGPFLSAMRKRWERSPEEFTARYVKGELLSWQDKRASEMRKEQPVRAKKASRKTDRQDEKKAAKTGRKPLM